MLIGGFYLFSFLWNSLKRRNIEWNCPSGQRVSHKLLNNRFTERREKSWIWCASCWKYIKRYGTMIGLFELHSRQRARQSQTCSDLVCCLSGSDASVGDMREQSGWCSQDRKREGAISTTNNTEWSCGQPCQSEGDWRKRKGEDERERRGQCRRASPERGIISLPTSALPPHIFYTAFSSHLSLPPLRLALQWTFKPKNKTRGCVCADELLQVPVRQFNFESDAVTA